MMETTEYWRSSKFALKLTTNRTQKKKAAKKSANTRKVQGFVKRMKEAS